MCKVAKAKKSKTKGPAPPQIFMLIIWFSPICVNTQWEQQNDDFNSIFEGIPDELNSIKMI